MYTCMYREGEVEIERNKIVRGGNGKEKKIH